MSTGQLLLFAKATLQLYVTAYALDKLVTFLDLYGSAFNYGRMMYLHANYQSRCESIHKLYKGMYYEKILRFHTRVKIIR